MLGLLDGMRVATLLEVTDERPEHGRSVLRLASPLETLPEEDRVLLESALPRLEEARRARPAPGRDDKVITAWNALMASALARTGAALQQDALVDAAEACVGFLLDSLVRDGRLLRTWRNGAAHTLAYADDYAALVNACIDLYEVTGSLYWLDEAQGLAKLVRLFWDTAAGGLFYTGHDGEALVSRSKRMLSGAEPSANGLAAWAFARLPPSADETTSGATPTTSSLATSFWWTKPRRPSGSRPWPRRGGRAPCRSSRCWSARTAHVACSKRCGASTFPSPHWPLWPLRSTPTRCSGFPGSQARPPLQAGRRHTSAKALPARSRCRRPVPSLPSLLRRGGAPTGRSALAATVRRPCRPTLHTGSTADNPCPWIGSRGTSWSSTSGRTAASPPARPP